MAYTLTWITSQLAVGSAPMSYEDLDAITERRRMSRETRRFWWELAHAKTENRSRLHWPG
ncbi:MAG: hypothetical protein Q8R42_07655 [Desulfocapsaceae bacterium]|nr:hypothetical protein [Desulfocapsaceae bacterium]